MEYLDFNATAPLLPECKEVVSDWLNGVETGNPSSRHGWGRARRALLEDARGQIAQSLDVGPSCIVFTSGATESLYMGLHQALEPLFLVRERPLVISHEGVHEALAFQLIKWDRERRIELKMIPLDRQGQWNPEDFVDAGATDAALVCVSHSQHETGVVFPVERLREQFPETPFLVDAVQSFGKIPLEMGQVKADWLIVSGHKIGALPGVGALVMGKVQPGNESGSSGQESGWRPGTENGPGIVSFGEAARHLKTRIRNYQRCGPLRDRLEQGLMEVEGVTVVASGSVRLPNTSLMLLDGLDAEDVQEALYRLGFCVGTGAACASVSGKPSPTLLSMGYSSVEIGGSIRISMGPDEVEETVIRLIATLKDWVPRLRAGEFPPRSTFS